MWMAGALRCFSGGALVRLRPDSARTRNVIAKMIASQKISRPAFDVFMVLSLLLRASVPESVFTSNRS
jgi:hypothetical protein